MLKSIRQYEIGVFEMQLYILPVLEQCFETIAEPFFSITLPSLVTKYVQSCISVRRKNSPRSKIGLLAPRLARTRSNAPRISFEKSIWKKRFLKVCAESFGSHDATRIYSLNSFKRNPARSQKGSYS